MMSWASLATEPFNMREKICQNHYIQIQVKLTLNKAVLVNYRTILNLSFFPRAKRKQMPNHIVIWSEVNTFDDLGVLIHFQMTWKCYTGLELLYSVLSSRIGDFQMKCKMYLRTKWGSLGKDPFRILLGPNNTSGIVSGSGAMSVSRVQDTFVCFCVTPALLQSL